MPQEPKPPLPELTSELGATIYAFENRGQFRAVQVFTDGTNFLPVTAGLSKGALRKAAKKAVKFATIEEALAKLTPVRSQEEAEVGSEFDAPAPALARSTCPKRDAATTRPPAPSAPAPAEVSPPQVP